MLELFCFLVYLPFSYSFYYDHSFLHESLTSKTVSFSIQLFHNNPNSNNNPIIYITDFGGDPKGINDSTTAFLDAIHYALTNYGSPNITLNNGIIDLGGVTISLAGGNYIISKPLLIPSNYGNLRIMDGTIRASKNFEPRNEFLITIGNNRNAGNCNGAECNQNINIQNMAFDCNHICNGCINLYYTTMTSIGPNMFITGFNEVGIKVFASGGTMIHNVYLAEYMVGNPNKHMAKSTAIQMFTHDSYLTNCVIFNAALGIHLNGSANILNGIHIWGLTANKNITNLTDQIGILGDGYCHDVRILNCYFDWNHFVVVSPIYAISIENTFFLAGGSVIFKADSSNSQIRGFNMKDSIFTIGKYEYNVSTIMVDESNGNRFTEISNVIINGMQLNGNYGAKEYRYHLKTTSTESVLTQINSTKWIFDFNDVLLFKSIGISRIDYSVKIEPNSVNKFIQYYAMIDEAVDNKTVVVYTNKPCDATIYMKVDQSTYNPELN